MSNRIEFTEKTKQIVAGRAGYRCSMPDCRAMTLGPGHTSEQIALTGTACHIFSAAGGGPRGQGGLSQENLRHPNNGIWMCENHGKLVDTNDGGAYPASLLISMRNLHEAWVAREQHGIHAPFGWVQELRLLSGPIFALPFVIRLGKVTIVIGNNSTGKTTLCEWLRGATDPVSLWRWVKYPDSQYPLRYSVTYYMPQEHRVLIEVQEDETIYSIDDRAVPFNPLPFQVVGLAEPKPGWEKLTDLQQISELLQIDKLIAKNLLKRLKPTNPVVTRAEVERGETVRIDVVGTAPGLQWRGISGGEQIRVAVELALMLADINSQFHPTVLMLDWGMARLDNRSLGYFANRLSNPEHKFQSIIATNERYGLSWEGWQIARLLGRPPKVMIEQEVVS